MADTPERTEKALRADERFRGRVNLENKNRTAKRLKFEATSAVMPKLRGDDITLEGQAAEEAVQSLLEKGLLKIKNIKRKIR